MKGIRLGFVVLVVGVLVAAIACSSAAAAAAAAAAGEDSSTAVYAVGTGTFGPGCAINNRSVPFCYSTALSFQVFAAATASGRVIGRFTRTNVDTGGTFVGRVTCLRIEGSDAVVGGMLTHAPQPGLRFLVPFGFVLHDGGPSAADWISPLQVFAAGDAGWASLPPGFPAVCPTRGPLIAGGYFPLTSGGWLVHNG